MNPRDDLLQECQEAKDKAIMLAQSLWACGSGEVETRPSFYFAIARMMEEIGNTLDKMYRYVHDQPHEADKSDSP